jgi:L-lactate dehydrogenase (cytochrome)
MRELRNVTCIEDLRTIARRKVPRAFFDYAEAGSYSEQTLRANRAGLEAINLRQRVLIDVSARDTVTTILGEPVSAPLALGPVAMTGLEHGNGEILACRAAQAAGIPYTLSTMSICSIEDVAEAVEKPFWFQLYVMKDRGFVRALIDRAAAASAARCRNGRPSGARATSQRYQERPSVPPSLKIGNLINMASKPRWAASVLSGKRWTFGNLDGHVKGMSGVTSLAGWISGQFDPTLHWEDIEWIRSIWPGKLVLKGILDPADAELELKSGADALVVSNRGGRQLDGAR